MDVNSVEAAPTWLGALILLAICLSPLATTWLTGRQRLAEREQTWARQDEVAARLLEAQAEQTERHVETNEKLERIRVEVNGNMTAALENELVAYRSALVLLEAEHRREPTTSSGSAVELMQTKITELDAQIKERKRE